MERDRIGLTGNIERSRKITTKLGRPASPEQPRSAVGRLMVAHGVTQSRVGVWVVVCSVRFARVAITLSH